MVRARGFTLLEVLVAMAVFAVAAMALLNAGRDQIQASSRLEDKTLAHWVAMNRVVELQIAGRYPDTGRGESKVRMADRDWRVLTEVENTPVPNVRRLTVDVSAAPIDFGDEPPLITSLTAFVSRERGGQNAAQP